MMSWQRNYRRGMGLSRFPEKDSRMAVRRMIRGPFAGMRAPSPSTGKTRLGWFVYYHDR